MSEQEKFLSELPGEQQSDPFAQFETPLTPEEGQASEAKKEEPQEEGEERFNRRERRLMAKLQAERESSIALAARLEALSEAQKFRSETQPSEYVQQVERIYGTNSPEAKEATELLARALQGVETKATEKALEAFRAEQAKAQQAVKNEESRLETMVEEIEDQYGVTLDKATQKEFFQRLEKLSPKDSEGNVVAYADHHAVWEDLQSRKPSTTNRAKDIASRSMARTGAPASTKDADNAHEKWLSDNGII
jgi:DNA gyrase/topoisomerase IV subunit A